MRNWEKLKWFIYKLLIEIRDYSSGMEKARMKGKGKKHEWMNCRLVLIQREFKSFLILNDFIISNAINLIIVSTQAFGWFVSVESPPHQYIIIIYAIQFDFNEML